MTTRTPVTHAESAERLRGIALVCIGMLMLSLLDTGAKYAAQYVPTLEVVWFRYALSVVLTVAFLRPWRRPEHYVTRRPALQVIRASFLLGSTIFNFFALRYLQLAEASAISFAAPLILTALAGPVLGEWPGPRRWAAVIIGFVGVLIIVQPEPGAFNPAAFLSVGAACCYAGYNMTTRKLSATDGPIGMLIYGSLLGAVVLAPALPLVDPILPPTWLVTLALSSQVLGWLLITVSLPRLPAALTALVAIACSANATNNATPAGAGGAAGANGAGGGSTAGARSVDRGDREVVGGLARQPRDRARRRCRGDGSARPATAHHVARDRRPVGGRRDPRSARRSARREDRTGRACRR